MFKFCVASLEISNCTPVTFIIQLQILTLTKDNNP